MPNISDILKSHAQKLAGKSNAERAAELMEEAARLLKSESAGKFASYKDVLPQKSQRAERVTKFGEALKMYKREQFADQMKAAGWGRVSYDEKTGNACYVKDGFRLDTKNGFAQLSKAGVIINEKIDDTNLPTFIATFNTSKKI